MNATRMAPAPASSLAHPRTAQYQVLRPRPSAGPGPLAEGLLEKESELPTSDLRGRVFPVGLDGFNVTSLSLKLDSGWESFLSGGSQLPRCCNLFSCFCREVFFLSSSGCVVGFFFATKRTHMNSVLSFPPLHTPTPNCDLPVLTVKSLVS